MRLRHIKGSEEKVKLSDYVINNPFEYIGKFNKLFGNDNPIEVEIGCGKGDFLINKAIDNKNINYIGIEKYSTVLLFALNKLKYKNLVNLKFIVIDAINIDKLFYKEVNKLYLNFSDPWPKKRHENRRLTSGVFLKRYNSIFKKFKVIEMKTDNDNLFSYSVKSFIKHGYFVTKYSRNYFGKYKTEYENKFINKGKNINFIKVIKFLFNFFIFFAII